MNATLQCKYSTNDRKRPTVSIRGDTDVMTEVNVHCKIRN